MSTVSKEILDKLRQLSDLLIVIKDSGNNTPQILKELAVEKCSEIYSALASDETVEYKIIDSPKEEVIEEPITENKATEIVFCDNTMDEEPLCEPNEEDTKEESFELPEISIDEITTQDDEEEKIIINSEATIEIENNTPITDFNFEENEEEIETDSYEEDSTEEVYNDILIEDEDEDEQEEDFDLFASKESYKKCSHKKIRSVLSINDIFLYKRELFGNSDVDMTDMFDGIDETESFEDAMELISEYFGGDVETEELVIEFIERVKQCFE